MVSIRVGIHADKDLIRKGFEAPAEDIEDDASIDMQLGRISVATFDGGGVVRHHRVDEPCRKRHDTYEGAPRMNPPESLTTFRRCASDVRVAERFKPPVGRKNGVAKRRSGLGRFLGAVAGSPYERLLKELERVQERNEEDDAQLAKEVLRFTKMVMKQYEDDRIDEEEHDLIIEAAEEVDPNGRSFTKLGEDGDEFYDMDAMPSAPSLKRGKSVDLDDLLRSKEDSFTGTFGKDEFDEFKDRMTESFYADSDEAIQAGDHQVEIRTDHRVFGSAEDEVARVKAEIEAESGMSMQRPQPVGAEPEEAAQEQEDEVIVDEEGVEWFEDESGQWWLREPGAADWELYQE